jgi:glucose/arabinose dehydrogenase
MRILPFQRRWRAARGLSLLALAALLAVAHSAALSANPAAPQSLSLVLAAQGFTQPTDIAHTGQPADQRLFVVERAGRIRVIPAGGGPATTFLDITGLTGTGNSEEGLLGLAFDPAYASTGRFFVYYTNNDGDNVLARYAVSGNPNIANPAGQVLLTIWHPCFGNHNGGDLAFGPDGYLYVAVGDGGSGGDAGCRVDGQTVNENDAQRLDSLLGKLLRLDVGGGAYTVPPDNPFVGVAGARGEIWALGLRNPWRISFDRLTGDLYVADVGQQDYEEVNYVPADSPGGVNFGWRCYEGAVPENLAGCGSRSAYRFPFYAYGRGLGTSVTGGFVYRGPAQPGLQGLYFFADFGSGRLWAATAGGRLVAALSSFDLGPSTFGEDAAGEVYLADYGQGRIYRLTGSVSLSASHLPVVTR